MRTVWFSKKPHRMRSMPRPGGLLNHRKFEIIMIDFGLSYLNCLALPLLLQLLQPKLNKTHSSWTETNGNMSVSIRILNCLYGRNIFHGRDSNHDISWLLQTIYVLQGQLPGLILIWRSHRVDMAVWGCNMVQLPLIIIRVLVSVASLCLNPMWWSWWTVCVMMLSDMSEHRPRSFLGQTQCER